MRLDSNARDLVPNCRCLQVADHSVSSSNHPFRVLVLTLVSPAQHSSLRTCTWDSWRSDRKCLWSNVHLTFMSPNFTSFHSENPFNYDLNDLGEHSMYHIFYPTPRLIIILLHTNRSRWLLPRNPKGASRNNSPYLPRPRPIHLQPSQPAFRSQRPSHG
jgi:hypothetical protein